MRPLCLRSRGSVASSDQNLYAFLCRNCCNLQNCVNYDVESVLMSGKASDSVHINLNTDDAPECNSLVTLKNAITTHHDLRLWDLKASWFRCILHNLNLYVHLQSVSLPTMPNENKNSKKITKQTKKTWVRSCRERIGHILTIPTKNISTNVLFSSHKKVLSTTHVNTFQV